MPESALTLASLRKLMATLRFNSHLGIRVARLHSDGVTLECPIRPHYLNRFETLHGGLTATLVDAAGGFATTARYGGRSASTVEMKINYFLPITGKIVRARARVLRAGKTLCVSRVDVQDGRKRLAATALVTYILLGKS